MQGEGQYLREMPLYCTCINSTKVQAVYNLKQEGNGTDEMGIYAVKLHSRGSLLCKSIEPARHLFVYIK